MKQKPISNTESFINPYKMFVGSFIPNWLIKRKELTPGAKLCYSRLCQYSGKNGKCFPKILSIANEIGVSERQISRYVDELKTFNLIVVRRPGLGKSNEYLFCSHIWMTEIEGISDEIPEETAETDAEIGKSRPDINGMSDRTYMSGQELTLMSDPTNKENQLKEEDKRKKQIPPSPQINGVDIYNNVKDLWNVFAHDNGLAQVVTLNHRRKNKIRTRMKEKDFNFPEILTKIKESGFMLGINDRGWRVDFDWIFNSDHNYLKVIEGNYRNHSETQTKPGFIPARDNR